jgi:dienelactone hydrolase
MRHACVSLLPLLLALSARAEVQTKLIEYKHGDVTLEGYFAWDSAAPDKRPGVLICHEWTGHNPYVRKRAEQLAKAGYCAFALDMYGKGVVAKDAQDAAAKADVFKKDRSLMRQRAKAGLEVLLAQAPVDASKVAVMGYCFGGTCALELGRSGAPIAVVVSFHGDLSSPNAADAKNIKGRVLALHGADDPFVPPAQVAAFENEMRKANVDWQLTKYGDAVHSFTNPSAGNDKTRGAAYNEKADKRSWAAMMQLFQEAFNPEPAPGRTPRP